MFMQIQMHLRGKANREAREQAMLEILRQSQQDELARLAERRTGEAASLRKVAAMEVASLRHGHGLQLEKIQNAAELKIADLGRQMMAERHWFEVVTHRRHALLEELRNDQLKTMGESWLLEGWEALPFPAAGPRFSFSEDGPEQLPPLAHVTDTSTPAESCPDTTEQAPSLPVTTDPGASLVPDTKPPKPMLFISTVMTESHITDEGSSQSMWEAESHRSGQSGTTSTTSRLSLHLQRRGGIKADKVSRWSFLTGSKKEHMDEETLKAMLRRTVGDAF